MILLYLDRQKGSLDQDSDEKRIGYVCYKCSVVGVLNVARKVYEWAGDDTLRLMNWYCGGSPPGGSAGRSVGVVTVILTSGGPRSELSRLCTSAGWRRELVRRGCGDTADRVDCYYFTPEGRKLRSLVQIQSVRECSHHQHIG